jgi:hypothetical protein
MRPRAFARGASDQAAVGRAVIALVEPLPKTDVDRMQRVEGGAFDEVQALLAQRPPEAFLLAARRCVVGRRMHKADAKASTHKRQRLTWPLNLSLTPASGFVVQVSSSGARHLSAPVMREYGSPRRRGRLVPDGQGVRVGPLRDAGGSGAVGLLIRGGIGELIDKLFDKSIDQ